MRRLYLVSYDIRDPRRLQRVHHFMKQRAVALQYSVFVFEGTEADRRAVREGLEDRIDPAEDDVRIYTLPEGVEVLPVGATDPLPRGVVLVGVAGRHRLFARQAATRSPGTAI